MQIPAEMIHYGMTKTVQLAISRGLAETTAGTGIVNTVLPGPTASEGVTFLSTTWLSPREEERLKSRPNFRTMRPSSLRSGSRPDEVAALVVFLAVRSLRQRMVPPSAQMAGWCVRFFSG